MQVNRIQSMQNPSFNARIEVIRNGSLMGPREILGGLIDRARYIGTDSDLIRVKGGISLQRVYGHAESTVGSMYAEFIRNGKVVHTSNSCPEPGDGTEESIRNSFSNFLSMCR